jgi:MSHA pilin protein MshA
MFNAVGVSMHGRSHGFTLVEQLAAITIAGTASVAALPVLVEFQAQAEQTALASLAAAAGSAMVLNQAGCLVTQQQPVPGKCETIADCRQVQGLLLVDLPPGYRVQAQPLAGTGGDTCRLLRDSDGASAGFYGAATGR